MTQQRSILGNIPPVVKNLLIINGLMLFATYLFQQGISIPGFGSVHVDLSKQLGLYTPGSEHFHFYQYITYMFMHGGINHILYNMIALFFFGRVLEQYWGPQRFLFFYMVTGVGAGLVNVLIAFIRVKMLAAQVPPEALAEIYHKGQDLLYHGQNYVDGTLATLNQLLNVPTIGASGAIFGILLAFGMLFPNEKIYVYFLIPVKAKWLVIGYGAFELYNGIMNQAGDNVAHLAHLGGMAFGFFLIRHWRNQRFN